MENASKALIIAGAILLSILIIGLGMMLFNQAKSAMDTSAIDELAVQQYNADFEAYKGTSVKGANVRTLVEKVISHNRSHQDDESLLISIDGDITIDSNNPTDSTQVTKVKTGISYTVEMSEYSTSGYLTKITITEK